MSRSSMLCLDANLVISYVAQDDPPAAVGGLWRRWIRSAASLHAPTLFRYEIANSLHRLRQTGRMPAHAASAALSRTFRIPVTLHGDDGLHQRAFELAADHDLPAAYDAHYLALAERLGVEFWTMDAKLGEAVQDRLPWVRLVS